MNSNLPRPDGVGVASATIAGRPHLELVAQLVALKLRNMATEIELIVPRTGAHYATHLREIATDLMEASK